MTFRILTVCTANICRSPVAQVFLADFLKDYPVQVHSAGTLALNGNHADQTMQELIQERGFEQITAHRSQALMPSLIAKYDLLLCMEDEHLDWILARSPVATAKVKLLGRWDQSRQVSDPIGRQRDVYADSVQEIEHLSRLWADKLIGLGVLA
jgi:protein-tyrosine phosphatase